MNPESELELLESTETDEIDDETEELEAVELEAPKFVVKTTLNVDTQLEASRALMPKFARLLTYFCMGIAAVMLVVLVWQYFATKNSSNLMLAAVLALMLVYLLYSQFSAPKKALQRWESDMQSRYGTNEMHLTSEFFALNLAQSIDETDDVIVEGYSGLGRMIETEHMLLLQCGRRQWFFLSKEGVTGGTLDEFKSFLSERIGGN